MIVFNQLLIDALSRSSVQPRFVLAQSFDEDNTDILYIGSHNDCAYPASAAQIMHGSLSIISNTSQEVKTETAKSSIGSIQVSFLDHDQYFTNTVNTKLAAGLGLNKKRAQLYWGVQGASWDDYQLVATQILDKTEYKDGSYTIGYSDIQRIMQETIFEPLKTTLAANITATATRIPLNAPTGYFPAVQHDNSYFDRPNETVFYLLIEEEAIACNGYDGQNAIVAPNGRGALNTRASDHNLKQNQAADKQLKVEEIIYLEGPLPKVIHMLWTGKDHTGQVILPSHWHLGVKDEFVRTSDFTNLGDDIWNVTTNEGSSLRIIGENKIKGKEFIETQALIWMNAFMPIYSSGEAGLKISKPILSSASYVGELNETNILSYQSLQTRNDLISNKISIKWNYDWQEKEFTKNTPLIDITSINLHGLGREKTIELRTVHTGKQVENDIIDNFNAYRDRFSNPPLTITVTAVADAETLSWEIGDIVRLKTDRIKDANAGSDLDRSFEIRRIVKDWSNGRLIFLLFASSSKAGQLQQISTTTVLSQAFYEANAVDLSTVLTITNGVVQSSGHIPGNLRGSLAQYYFIGDLVIPNGVNITFDLNIRLFVMGVITQSGGLIGRGRGSAQGVVGSVRAGSGVFTYANQPTRTFGTASLPFYKIINTGTTLLGLPDNLMGVKGSDGGNVDSPSGTATGGTGGDGGAGLFILARGWVKTGSALVDVSGELGQLGGTFLASQASGFIGYAGTGAAGHSGGILYVQDGGAVLPDDKNIIADSGGYNLPANAEPWPFTAPGNYLLSSGRYYSQYQGFDVTNSVDSVTRFQFVPPADTPEEELTPPPSNVIGFNAIQSGENVNFSWLTPEDISITGTIIKFGEPGIAWDDANILLDEYKGTAHTAGYVPPGDYDFMARHKNAVGQLSISDARRRLTVNNVNFDTISDISYQPNWTDCVRVNMGIHHTGIVYPQSAPGSITMEQAVQQYGWAAFDTWPLIPANEYSIETPEQDGIVEAPARIYANIDVCQVPGTTAAPVVTTEADYRDSSGSYDGFESWTVGEKNTRFAKFRFSIKGSFNTFIKKVRTVIDAKEIYENRYNIDVPVGGRNFDFNEVYRQLPFLNPQIIGATELFIDYSVLNLTTTGCFLLLRNKAGADVGGVINLKITGN